GPSQDPIDPNSNVVGRDRLGCKFGKIVAARKRELQFRHASANLVHAQHIGDLLVAVLRYLGREKALLFDEAIDVSIPEGPAITLVLREPMHHGNGATSSVRLQLNRTE